MNHPYVKSSYAYNNTKAYKRMGPLCNSVMYESNIIKTHVKNSRLKGANEWIFI